MHISFVKIKNYRGIKADHFEASPFTCAIGENNAGKSTILLAASLFFSGTALGKSDFYNVEELIEIEITFTEIDEKDIRRLSEEHRERIKEIMEDEKLVLTRQYSTDGKSEMLCSRLSPKDTKFNKDVVGGLMKGKKGKEISASVIVLFPEYKDKLENLTTQKDVYAKLDEIIAELPLDQKELKLSPLPTGIENSITKFLPEPIYIAAVKDLKDDVKSKESATFGKLLGILMKFLENSKHFEKISQSFNELHSLLNVIREAEQVTDNRIDKLQTIEKQIGNFLAENFPKSKLEIDIPKPELKQVFSNARILIDDGVRDIIETKGDGIKRAVTFALLRTYVEQLKEQKREIALAKKSEAVEAAAVGEAVQVEEVNEQPYLFLFEEPELYLHPNAQKILFEALENLTTEHNQVFVTTHSPMFFSPQATGTFIKVIKEYPGVGKPFGKFLTINLLKEIQAKDAFQIICFENNTAAFFSNKVLLVEGDSDLIYIKEVARLLNSEWNFDIKNIPIISINGKSNIKRFIEFYNFFQIKCYCIVDSDALIDGFEKFEVSEEIKLQRSTLLNVIDKLVDEKGVEADLPRDKIKEIVRRYTWKDSFKRLKIIGQKISKGESVTPEELIEIEFLFAEEINNRRRQIFIDKEIIVEGKSELLQVLRNQNIFILSHGAIESYYPNGIVGDDKPTKALNAINFLKEQPDCKVYLPTIKIGDEEKCELEIIYEKIFEA
jgi:putative ATP-dependent endonuclease of OLD family